MPEVTDRIEKKIMLRAPRERVWKAITDAQQFGTWFGVKFDGPFKLGEVQTGTIVTTAVDPEVAKEQQPYAGMPFEVRIATMEPERLFSFRWSPYAVDAATGYANEPTTLVEFQLEEAPGGILLTVTESGFDQVPLARRAKAFTENEQGWTMMVKVLEKYLANGG
jgi:uncharacterized protein YndB with AHSA1/START domain